MIAAGLVIVALWLVAVVALWRRITVIDEWREERDIERAITLELEAMLRG
jgi:hypothetical protein